MQEFKTYAFPGPGPSPSLSSLYPYYRFDGFTNRPGQKKWKIVELQNDCIKVLITPEMGAKYGQPSKKDPKSLAITGYVNLCRSEMSMVN